MVTVHVCWSDGEAAIVMAYLESQGIESRMNSEVPHTVLPLTVDGLGEVRVMVVEEDADRARQVLRERQEEARNEDGDEEDAPGPR